MRLPPVLDLVLTGLGVVMTAIAWSFVVEFGPHPIYVTYGLIHVGLTTALYFRHLRPRTSFVVAYALLAFLAVLYFVSPVNLGVTPMLLCAPLSLATVTRWLPSPAWGITGLLLGIVGSFFSPVRAGGEWPALGWGAVAAHVLILVVVYLWAAARRRAAEEHRAELEAQATSYESLIRIREVQAAAEEREKIAREIHDIVAHSLTVVQVQSSTGLALGGTEQMKEALMQVSNSSKHALSEVRSLVSLLRTQQSETAVAPPNGDLTMIPPMIAEAERAGVVIDVAVPPDDVLREWQGSWPAMTSLTVLRVVQEALTNVVKHAGPAARAFVRVARHEDSCVVDVVNSVAPWRQDTQAETIEEPSSAHAGYGLLGLRERLQLVEGEFVVGTEDFDGDQGFGVHARIPIEKEHDV